MRILVVSAPLVGHLMPLVPLARALRDAGHDVLIAAGGDAAAVDTDGIGMRDISGGVSLARLGVRVMLTRPRLVVRELRGRAGTQVVGELFGWLNAAVSDAVVEYARSRRPDVVVHEPLAVSGAVAAARLGVPAVLQENSLWDAAELVAATGGSPAMRRALQHHGLDALPDPALTIRTAPPGLVGARHGAPMRAVPHSGGGLVPEWLREPGPRRVFVSRSTVAGPAGGDPTAAVVVVAAEATAAEFVLVRAPGSVTRRALPANVRATGWLPLAEVLPGAAGFVHHGGAGGVLGALHAGVPQLIVPGAGDRRFNADTVARRGAGLTVEARRITAGTLTSLVDDPALRRAAGEVAAEMAAMPEPAELVPLIENM